MLQQYGQAAQTYEAEVPDAESDWDDVARRVTTCAASGGFLKDWVLCDGMLEKDALVLVSRVDAPWSSTAASPGSRTVSSQTVLWTAPAPGHAAQQPQMTLNQKRAFIK